MAPRYERSGIASWASEEPKWGIWGVPESTLHLLPDRLEGLDAVELGCGTAYVSSWLARRGAKPVGVDVTPEQLAAAARFQRTFGIHFPLVLADVEASPLRDESFDFAVSEYGASNWCDPYRWIPEAARLLRPGGELVFLVMSPILVLAVHDTDAEGPADDRLRRDYFGLHRIEWPDDTSVEFHLGYGDWIRLLGNHSFEVTDLVEVRPPADAQTSNPFVALEWARRWPCEQVWKARKRGGAP